VTPGSVRKLLFLPSSSRSSANVIARRGRPLAQAFDSQHSLTKPLCCSVPPAPNSSCVALDFPTLVDISAKSGMDWPAHCYLLIRIRLVEKGARQQPGLRSSRRLRDWLSSDAMSKRRSCVKQPQLDVSTRGSYFRRGKAEARAAIAFRELRSFSAKLC
jgi:hypothetical protein